MLYAKLYGWKKKNPNVFTKKDMVLRVTPGPYGKYKVETELSHPKHGKTKVLRLGITEKELEQIFKDPRTHTSKGIWVNEKADRLNRLFEKVEKEKK